MFLLLLIFEDLNIRQSISRWHCTYLQSEFWESVFTACVAFDSRVCLVAYSTYIFDFFLQWNTVSLQFRTIPFIFTVSILISNVVYVEFWFKSMPKILTIVNRTQCMWCILQNILCVMIIDQPCKLQQKALHRNCS